MEQEGKEGKHEKGGNAVKLLTRPMNLIRAKPLRAGAEGWFKRRKHLDFVHYLRMHVISLCTWEHTTRDILQVQESGQLTLVGYVGTCFLFSVVVWTSEWPRGSGLMDSNFRMDRDVAHKYCLDQINAQNSLAEAARLLCKQPIMSSGQMQFVQCLCVKQTQTN